jgi:hypothetical protein
MGMATSVRRVRFVMFSVVSAMLLSIVVMGVAFVFRDTLLRYRYMGMLCKGDREAQLKGVNYLVRHAEDPAVIEHAKSMLRSADDACFEQIVRALSVAQVWGPNFEEAWPRYLLKRVDHAEPKQRAAIAVELGKMLWLKRTGWDDARVESAIEKLLGDADADVRLNALSAAAVSRKRMELVQAATKDAVEPIRHHAEILLKLLRGETVVSGTAPGPGPQTPEELKKLAELESMATNSADVAITTEMPMMQRIQAVRVSKTAKPQDLMIVFNQPQAVLRDLACVVAMERFGAGECAKLAAELLKEYSGNERMSGAILAGMSGDGGVELRDLLKLRMSTTEDWVLQQHCRLGLWMLGERGEGFDPLPLLMHEKVPRTTVTLALLHAGKLEGLDWLLNPWGNPPLPLTLVLDSLRFEVVLKRYVPGLPEFWVWADLKTQKTQADVIRDWYLLNRPGLRFDAEKRVFVVGEHGDSRRR